MISIHALREEGDFQRTHHHQAQADFYPRPPRGGRRADCGRSRRQAGISIHALREEGDYDVRQLDAVDFEFLSTPSARRATLRSLREHLPQRQFLSTPSARRATDLLPGGRYFRDISIHALREEGDPSSNTQNSRTSRFLSTPSARRATRYAENKAAYQKIFLSTPSARRATEAECGSKTPEEYFYPRPPRGGRQQKQRQNLYFQTNYTTFCTNLEEP